MTDCNLCINSTCLKHSKSKEFPLIWEKDLPCFRPIKPFKVKVANLAWTHPQGMYDVLNRFGIKANLYT